LNEGKVLIASVVQIGVRSRQAEEPDIDELIKENLVELRKIIGSAKIEISLNSPPKL
jgi:hypothetical protein